MDLTFGIAMTDGGQPGQAARLLDRRLQLLPGDPEAGLAMAKCYLTLHQPAKTLALVRQLRGSTNVSAWDLDRCEAVACMAGQDYAAAEKILRDALRQAPTTPIVSPPWLSSTAPAAWTNWPSAKMPRPPATLPWP